MNKTPICACVVLNNMVNCSFFVFYLITKNNDLRQNYQINQWSNAHKFKSIIINLSQNVLL